MRLLLLLILSLTMGFGMWYLFGWFISNERNLFLWPWWGKILFLIFGLTSSSNIIKNTENFE